MTDFSLRHETGYTTIELLIAIQISFLTMSLCYFSYLIILKFSRQWEQKQQMEYQLSEMVNQIDWEFNRISDISMAKTGELQGIDRELNLLHWCFRDNLYINNRSFFQEPLYFRHGSFFYQPERSSISDNLPDPVQIPEKFLEKIYYIECRIHLTANDKSFFLLFSRRLKPGEE